METIDSGHTELVDLHIKTDSSTKIVSTADMKTYLEVEYSDHDSLIDSLILMAQEWIEDFVGRTLMQKTYIATYENVHINLLLPRPPVISVEKVEWVETDGSKNELTEANDDFYTLGNSNFQIRFSQVRTRPIIIEYKAGHSSASDVPDIYVDAIKRIVKTSYDSRGDINIDSDLQEKALKVPTITRKRLEPRKLNRI